jgi:GR25 family glycosyltransferase involved in LPS biosynthesis
LGVARHSGVIPWEDDLDFVIDVTKKEKLLSLKEELAKSGIGLIVLEDKLVRLYLLNREKISVHEWSWPYINVFYYKIVGDTVTVKDTSGTVKIPSNDFLPLKTNLFEGIPVTIPSNLDAILAREYGDDWEETCHSSEYDHVKDLPQKDRFTSSCRDAASQPIEQGIFDNVWVINLDRRPERWKATKKRLRTLGINPYRWSAADKDASDVVNKYYRIKPRIRKGEFACYESHLNLWKFLYESKVKYAIIFEDDISVPPSVRMKDVITTINDSKGFEVLFLGHCSTSLLEVKPTEVTSRIGSGMCTHAYAVSRKGLQKLVQHNHNYRHAVDAYLNRSFCQENLCYYSKNYKNSGHKIWGEGLFSQDDNFSTDVQNESWL